MPRRDTEAYLLDILIAARRARSFAGNLTFESFVANPLAMRAVYGQFVIMGEVLPGSAVRHPPGARPSLPP